MLTFVPAASAIAERRPHCCGCHAASSDRTPTRRAAPRSRAGSIVYRYASAGDATPTFGQPEASRVQVLPTALPTRSFITPAIGPLWSTAQHIPLRGRATVIPGCNGSSVTASSPVEAGGRERKVDLCEGLFTGRQVAQRSAIEMLRIDCNFRDTPDARELFGSDRADEIVAIRSQVTRDRHGLAHSSACSVSVQRVCAKQHTDVGVDGASANLFNPQHLSVGHDKDYRLRPVAVVPLLTKVRSYQYAT